MGEGVIVADGNAVTVAGAAVVRVNEIVGVGVRVKSANSELDMSSESRGAELETTGSGGFRAYRTASLKESIRSSILLLRLEIPPRAATTSNIIVRIPKIRMRRFINNYRYGSAPKRFSW